MNDNHHFCQSQMSHLIIKNASGAAAVSIQKDIACMAVVPTIRTSTILLILVTYFLYGMVRRDAGTVMQVSKSLMPVHFRMVTKLEQTYYNSMVK